MRTNLLLTAAFFALAGSTAAQESGALPRVLDLPASPRAMALGDAYVTTAGHADAVFYHPGLVRGATGFGLSMQRWGSASSATAASAAVGWMGGSIGLGLQTLQFGGPGSGAGAAPAGQDHLFDLGPTPVSERVATVAYAREVFGLDLGVSTKLAEERVGAARAARILFDAGVATDVGPLRAALSYRNLGEGVTLSGEEITAPDRLTFGVGFYGRPTGIFDVGVSAAVSRVGSDVVPGGGLEIGYWPISGRTFVARFGVRRVVDGEMSPMSFGFAFWGDDLTLEWAFQPIDGDPSGSHSFGVRWR